MLTSELCLVRRLKDVFFRSTCGLACLVFVATIVALIASVASDGYTAFFRAKIYIESPHGCALCQKYGLEPDKLSFLMENHTNSGWNEVRGDVDIYLKDLIFRHSGFVGKLTHSQQNIVKAMYQNGDIKIRFNSNLFTQGDSVDPEKAGIFVSLMGSLAAVAMSMIIVFPIGIITGVCISGFINNRWLIAITELAIKSIASVPAVIVGVFGYSLYVKFLGLPKSSILVGGMTLGIIALPLITLTTKQAVSSLPNSIRYAALAMGASQLRVLCQHALPMSIPSITTGVILSIARIIGETAPLLIVGMVIFVQIPPSGVLDSGTTLPAQIHLWSKNPKYGFGELASAAIIVLISIIACLNIVGGRMKSKYSKRQNI